MNRTHLLIGLVCAFVVGTSVGADKHELLRDRFTYVTPGTDNLREIFISMPYFDIPPGELSHLGHQLHTGDGVTVDEKERTVSLGDGSQSPTTMKIVENKRGEALKVELTILEEGGDCLTARELKRSSDPKNPGWYLLSEETHCPGREPRK